MRKILSLVIIVFAFSGCSTSLKDLDDLSLVNAEEVHAEKRVEEQALKASLSPASAEAVEEKVAVTEPEFAPVIIEPTGQKTA